MWNHGRLGQSEVNGPPEVLLEWVRKHNQAFHRENSQVQVVEIQSREALLIIWRSQLPRQHCALARRCSIVKHLFFVYLCFDQSQIKNTFLSLSTHPYGVFAVLYDIHAWLSGNLENFSPLFSDRQWLSQTVNVKQAAMVACKWARW